MDFPQPTPPIKLLVCLKLQQHPCHAAVAVQRRPVQRRLPRGRGHVAGRAVLQQHFQHVRVPIQGRQVQPQFSVKGFAEKMKGYNLINNYNIL